MEFVDDLQVLHEGIIRAFIDLGSRTLPGIIIAIETMSYTV